MAALLKQPCSRQSELSTAGRHGHRQAYAAILLSGSYLEAGPMGRLTMLPGDVLIHEAFERHFNRKSTPKLEILNITLPDAPGYSFFARLRDPDAMVRLAEHDRFEASRQLPDQLLPAHFEAANDWTDLLQAAIEADPTLMLQEWAHALGVSPSTIGRGFAAHYGVSPSRYRLEAKTRCALLAIAKTRQPLAQIAADAGFADQAHMTRAICLYTGATPSLLRSRSHRCEIG